MRTFFICNLFISNAKLKIRQILSKTLRLKFCYFKIIHILHSCCHPKIILHILKNKQKKKYGCKNEDENEKQISYIRHK